MFTSPKIVFNSIVLFVNEEMTHSNWEKKLGTDTSQAVTSILEKEIGFIKKIDFIGFFYFHQKIYLDDPCVDCTGT